MSYISNEVPIALSRYHSALLHLFNALLTLFNLKTRHQCYCEGILLTPICVEIDRMKPFHCSLTFSTFLKEKLQNFGKLRWLRVNWCVQELFSSKVAVCITFLSWNLFKWNKRQRYFFHSFEKIPTQKSNTVTKKIMNINDFVRQKVKRFRHFCCWFFLKKKDKETWRSHIVFS